MNSSDEKISKKKIKHDGFCISRIWKNGGGGRCSRRKIYDTNCGGFCETHYTMYLECVKNSCSRGINGLGGCWVCKSLHDGLWLGTVVNIKPLYNQDGLLLPWKDSSYVKKKLKKKKDYKIKTVFLNGSFVAFKEKRFRKNKNITIKIKPMYNKMRSKGKKKISSTLTKTMEEINLDDEINTPDYIISLVEKQLEQKFKYSEKKWLHEEIDKIYDLNILKELSPSSDDDDDDYIEFVDSLDKIVVGDEEYLLDNETYRVYSLSKKPKYLGIRQADGSVLWESDF